MGIEWSKAFPVSGKNGQSLLIKAALPTNQLLSAQIWNLWNAHKTALKSDGFSMSKWPKTPEGIWNINYWDSVHENTYKKIQDDDGSMGAWYLVEFKRKYRKWKAKYNSLPAVVLKPKPAPAPIQIQNDLDDLEIDDDEIFDDEEFDSGDLDFEDEDEYDF